MRERGAALVTVLTMLAIMAALAIVAIDAAQMSLRRTRNQTSMEQTRWYLLGAEAFAIGRIADLRRRAADARVDQSEWQERWFPFPLEDGMMRVKLRDGGNCFNLNSMVEDIGEGVMVTSARGRLQFARLLDLAGVRSDRTGQSGTLADWIDSDQVAQIGGPEDAGYAVDGARPPNTLIADPSELRAVLGFDADTIVRLRGLVCVRPTAAANRINPNTLLVQQAPLLAMALPDISVATAAQIIRDRPRGGWEDLDAFFAQPRLASLEMSEPLRAQFSMQSDYVVLQARVERPEGRESSAALIQVAANGQAVVRRRVFGVGDGEFGL